MPLMKLLNPSLKTNKSIYGLLRSSSLVIICVMKVRLIVLLLFLFHSCSVDREEKKPAEEKKTQGACAEYFVSVPIPEYSPLKHPCVNVEIEGRQFLFMLDLGFRGDLAIDSQVLDSLDSKTFVKESLMYGVRSKSYIYQSYRIPKATIGLMDFSPPIVKEENPEFLIDSSIGTDDDIEPSKHVGRLGWELFQNSNLLLDFPHSRIAFCDSLDTLTKHGYQDEVFIRAPLLLERGLVELEAHTSDGVLRCMLDTGATVSVLNNDIEEEGKPLADFVWDPNNAIEYPSLKISGEEFGPIQFHPLPIRIPIRIEAILGMDFLKNHIIFLDFGNQCAYFSKTKETID